MNSFNSKYKTPAIKKIFISYREKDTAGETGRLVDALSEHFSEDQIFMDIEKIEPGTDFRKAISHSLQSCDIFLAVIGPNWLGNKANNSQPRIFDTNDWVRIEVATALQRNIRVIPVLVDDGVMPVSGQLPEDLHPLLNRQAYEISNKRWKYDTEQFISFLINSVGIQPKYGTKDITPEKRGWLNRNLILLSILLVLVEIGIFFYIKNYQSQEPLPESKAQPTSAEDSNSFNQQTGQYQKQVESNRTPAQKNPVPDRNSLISRTWIEQDEGATSTFYIQQNGESLTVDVKALGQKINTGTDTVRNKDVELRFDMFGNNVVLKATLQPDLSTMKGTYTFELTGEAQDVVLKKE